LPRSAQNKGLQAEFLKNLRFSPFSSKIPQTFCQKARGILEIQGFWQKIDVQNCCKTLLCRKNSGGVRKKVKFKQNF